MFWVISVYFNIRNTLPKSGTFLLEHLYLVLLMCLSECLFEISFNEVSLCRQNSCTEHTYFCRHVTYGKPSRLNFCSIYTDLIITLPVHAHIFSFTELQYFNGKFAVEINTKSTNKIPGPYKCVSLKATVLLLQPQ